MIKKSLLFFVIVILLLNGIPCFAATTNNQYWKGSISPVSTYTATLHNDNTISLEHTIDMTSYKTEKNTFGAVDDSAFRQVCTHKENFSRMPYVKNGYFMIPVKQTIDIEIKFREIIQYEYSNITKEQYTALSENNCAEIAEREKQVNTQQCIFSKQEDNSAVTISFQGNNIIFYKDKREATVNGYAMGLYAIPDIIDNDVFLCEKDFYSLFGCLYYYNDNDKKTVYWRFGCSGEKNNIPVYHCEPIIQEETFRISTEYDGTVFYKNHYGNKDNEKSIRVYEKNNHMMIAVNDITMLKGNQNNMETIWNSENNTVTLKFWYTMAKDVVFTKDSNVMTVNGEEIVMEEPTEIKDNRMYIPITALFQILEIPEQNIQWIEQGKNVQITYGKYRNWLNL